MRRKIASAYLWEVHGIQLSTGSLAKYAVEGGGPQSYLDGRFPLYALEELDRFAVARLGQPRASTSDYRSAA
jgi:hypothetical protein